MKKSLFFIAGIFLPVIFLAAQSISFKQLAPGDKLPGVVLKNLLGTSSQGGGKLILIDFWATWCSSCIGGFPKMQTMQEKFGDRLQVVLVNARQTRDTPEKIAATVDKFQKEKSFLIQLPMITGDTVLQQLFPHKYLPHIVWIDPEGKYLQSSFPDEVNEKNISALLDHGSNSMHAKKDSLEYDFTKPLFFSMRDSGLITYRSLFTPYIEGLGFNSGQLLMNDTYSKYTILNYPLEHFYQRAFQEELSLPFNQVLFSDSAETFKRRLLDRKNYSNQYCYELILKDSLNDPQLRRLIRSDVERMFGFTVKTVERNTDVIVVGAPLGKIRLPPLTKHAKSMEVPLYYLFQLLNEVCDIPVINATGWDAEKKMLLLIPANFKSFSRKEMIEYIRSFGFTYSMQKREMPFAVFVPTSI